MTLRIAILLGALALALGGCGGDDSGDGNPARDTSAAQTDTNAAGTDTNPNTTTNTKTETSKKTQGEPQVKLENSRPAPPLSDRQRKKNVQDLPTGAPKPKQDLTPKEKQIYEISLFFCKETGIEGMRHEYQIKSSDPADVAREAARRTYGRGGAEAVYSGCLEGLRQSK